MAVTYTKLSGDMALGSDGTEYLVLPYMFVPHGTEPCPKWLADHPGWFRIPATMRRRAARPKASEPVPMPQDTVNPVQLASADNAEADATTARSTPPPAPLLRITGKQPSRLVIFVGGFGDDSSRIVRNYFMLFPTQSTADVVYAGWNDQRRIGQLINDTPPGVSITVVGHSYGGDTAATAVAAAPRGVDVLVTVDPVSMFRPDYANIRKHTQRWININAVPGKNFDGSDIIAGLGSAWGRSVKEEVSDFIEDAHSHGNFSGLLTARV